MSIVYIKAIENSNLITHEDQEQHGLKFAILVQKDDYDYIKVTGEDNEINTWKTRVNGEDSNLDEINTIIASLPTPQNDIETLKSQNAQIILNLVNGGLM